MDNLLLILAGAFIFLITVLQYFEDRFCIGCLLYGQQIISVVIGATVVALFTEILDSAYLNIHGTNDFFVLIIPISFIVFLFLYRHIYSHGDDEKKSDELSMAMRFMAVFSDLLVGLLAFTHLKTDLFSEIVFLGILFSYELIEQLSFHLVHENKVTDKPRGVLKKVFFSLWALFGFVYAYFVGISEISSAVLIAIYAGAVFSVVVREIFSKERKIVFPYFLGGGLFFSVLFLVDKIIVL